MTTTQRLALLSLTVGAVMGLLVLAAAAAAGREKKLIHGLAGTAWGALASGLLLTDCLAAGGPGPISEAAFPLYYGGVIIWPIVLVWGQPRWGLRWLGAQLLLLLTALPAFVVAVASAYCTLT